MNLLKEERNVNMYLLVSAKIVIHYNSYIKAHSPLSWSRANQNY